MAGLVQSGAEVSEWLNEQGPRVACALFSRTALRAAFGCTVVCVDGPKEAFEVTRDTFFALEFAWRTLSNTNVRYNEDELSKHLRNLELSSDILERITFQEKTGWAVIAPRAPALTYRLLQFMQEIHGTDQRASKALIQKTQHQMAQLTARSVHGGYFFFDDQLVADISSFRLGNGLASAMGAPLFSNTRRTPEVQFRTRDEWFEFLVHEFQHVNGEFEAIISWYGAVLLGVASIQSIDQLVSNPFSVWSEYSDTSHEFSGTVLTVSASNRFVTVKDNQKSFDHLEWCLDNIKSEYFKNHEDRIRDQLDPELPSKIDKIKKSIQSGVVACDEFIDDLLPTLNKSHAAILKVGGICTTIILYIEKAIELGRQIFLGG